MSESKTMEKLNDSELENVAGGLLFYAGDVDGADNGRPWEVIDNYNGGVVRRFSNYDDAWNYARSFGSNPDNVREVKWDELQWIRNGRR
ncbi:MAG: hypothetical protein K6E34_10685 [Lachnospiraceae bacterium]|nr:hypothetical protein [Lachnospiraceae bacterium]